MPLANALVARGHNVTYIAAVGAEESNPLIKDIIPLKLKTYIEEQILADFNVDTRLNNEMPHMCLEIPHINYDSCEAAIAGPEIKEWLATGPKVDLIFGDIVFECAVGLAYKLNAKVAIFNTVSYWSRYTDLLGLPDESNSAFGWTIPFYKEWSPLKSFASRVINTLSTVFEHYNNRLRTDRFMALLKEHLQLPEDMPDMSVLEKDISLVMSAGNFATEHQRSLPPMFVSVAGLHVKDEVSPLAPVCHHQL
jgi:hypothetical protein